jgi:hypothetical protein
MNLHTESWKPLLYAVVDGEVDPGSAELLLKLTTSRAAEKGISKILIDGRLVTGNLSTAEREALGAKLADHVAELGTTPSIAVIGHPPAFTGQAASVASDRGVNIELFESIPEGLAFLRAKITAEKPAIAA